MTISELVFRCVKNAIYFDDYNFTYQSFLNGTYDDMEEYTSSIINVSTPINEAISRLNDLNKIPFKISELTQTQEKGIYQLPNDCLEVVGIAIFKDSKYYQIPFEPYGVGKVHIGDVSEGKVVCEYKQDIFFQEYNEMSQLEKQTNLLSYGITNSMCQYIIEYTKGKLFEPISADIGNMHIVYAESYFKNISSAKSFLSQQYVSPVFKII